MTPPSPLSPQIPARGSSPARRTGLPNLRRSDKVLGSCAAFLLLAGLLLKGYGLLKGGADADGVPPGTANSPMLTADGAAGRTADPGSSLVDSGSARRFSRPGDGERGPGSLGGTATEGEAGIEAWSPALIKGGFGFFAGFAIGLVLRIFFRLSTIVLGLNLLLLLGLSQAGWLEVRWDEIALQWEQWQASLGQQFSEFERFVSGSLPAVGLGGLGLLTGFRKR